MRNRHRGEVDAAGRRYAAQELSPPEMENWSESPDPSSTNLMVAFACWRDKKRMAIMRALTIGVVVAFAATAPAFAGGKGGGGHTSTEAPKSSTSLNYNKVEWTYSKQKRKDGWVGEM